MISDMERQGGIEPFFSPWTSPTVLVKWNMDLPPTEDILNAVTSAKWFSTIDLISGYWQIELALEDKEKTTF